MDSIDKYSIDEDVFQLRDAMDNILAGLESVYQSYNVPMPDRRFWTIGETPVVDCDQIAITFLQMYLGAPGDDAQQPQNCNGIRSMVVQINVSRKRALPRAGARNVSPAAEQIQGDAVWSTIDAVTIMNGIGSLDQFSMGQPQAIATVTANGFEGDYFTTSVQLTIPVP